MVPETERVVAIDGPAGSGKSTVAKLLARSLGWLYLDTGAIYRTLGLIARKEGVSLDNEDALANLCSRLHDLDFQWDSSGMMKVLLNGRDVTSQIRGEEAGRWASDVSRHPRVRTALLDLQRSFARRGPLVTEGRDTGTVVFPGAVWKVFLSASLEERARRRLKEMGLEETEGHMEEMKRVISERDLQDSNRAVAPLRKAPEALELDTTGLSPEEVLERIKEFMGLKAKSPGAHRGFSAE